MTDDAHVYLWPDDHAVLLHIVRQLEHEGQSQADPHSIIPAVNLEHDEFHRSIARLSNAGLIGIAGGAGARGVRDGVYLINQVTEKGLRAAGAWPTEAETIAQQLVAALSEAAAQTPDPEQRTRLRTAADSISAIGHKTFVEIMASYLAKSSGA